MMKKTAASTSRATVSPLGTWRKASNRDKALVMQAGDCTDKPPGSNGGRSGRFSSCRWVRYTIGVGAGMLVWALPAVLVGYLSGFCPICFDWTLRLGIL